MIVRRVEKIVHKLANPAALCQHSVWTIPTLRRYSLGLLYRRNPIIKISWAQMLRRNLPLGSPSRRCIKEAEILAAKDGVGVVVQFAVGVNGRFLAAKQGKSAVFLWD